VRTLARARAELLADVAVDALVDEARLTPKPALVDARGSGAHDDLDLERMLASAHALRETFLRIAQAAEEAPIDAALRARVGAIGRDGERAMLQATGGANAHRGAIWALGLLVAAAAQVQRNEIDAVTARAAAIAAIDDIAPDARQRHGAHARARYRVGGAVGQAQAGFPAIREHALPALRGARARGAPETHARVDALLALIAVLDDTCLLHRGGRKALAVAQRLARETLACGGLQTALGRERFDALERALLGHHASPGGAADLLAATLFLDRIASAR
jgi:triphosphoribosyl-dephospho-CoA synthase